MPAPCDLREVDLFHEPIDESCLVYLTARESWDHLVLPLRYEDGRLRCVTTPETAEPAGRFLRERLDVAFSLGVTERMPLEQFIAQLYGFEGIAA